MNNKEWLAGFKARIADQNMAGNEPKDWRGAGNLLMPILKEQNNINLLLFLTINTFF